MTGRKIDEWVGKTPDTRPPQRVRVRVFEAHGGKCAITGRKIHAGEAWELDHTLALINGGENRESNLQPVLKQAHKAKTAADVRAKSKAARLRAKHIGAVEKKPKSRWKKKIGGTVVDRETGKPVGQ